MRKRAVLIFFAIQIATRGGGLLSAAGLYRRLEVSHRRERRRSC